MPDPTTPSTESDGDKLTMGSLKKMIQDTVAEIVPGLIGSVKPPTPAGPAPATDVPADIAAQVRVQVERIRKQEEKQKTEAQVLADIAALKDAKPAEKVPVQRSKLHKVMGWGDPAE